MIDFLLGVPGKLKAISDHLTTHLASTRAAKIDNLDAAVTTRASASAATSIETKIDTLTANVDALSAGFGNF